MVAGSFEKEARTGKERKDAGVQLLRWSRGVTGEEGDPRVGAVEGREGDS